MPFIRYDQGDLVVFHDVKGGDGRPERRLTRIVGREDDYVTMPDGTRCTFDAIYEALDRYHRISQFRIIQRSRSLFQILVVAPGSYVSDIRDDLVRALKAEFLPGVSYEILPVDRIPPDASGKTRIFISEVD